MFNWFLFCVDLLHIYYAHSEKCDYAGEGPHVCSEIKGANFEPPNEYEVCNNYIMWP